MASKYTGVFTRHLRPHPFLVNGRIKTCTWDKEAAVHSIRLPALVVNWSIGQAV